MEFTMESTIKLLEANDESSPFENHVEAVFKLAKKAGFASLERDVLNKVFPLICTQSYKVYTNLRSFIATLDKEDPLTMSLVTVNLKIISKVTEHIQDFLQYIHEQESCRVLHIHSVLLYVPKFVHLFIDYYTDSCAAYKEIVEINQELFKVLESIKLVYTSLLYLLETSITAENDTEITSLSQVLESVCEIHKIMSKLDGIETISYWKSFGIITARFSSNLENWLETVVPVRLLIHDIQELIIVLLEIKETSVFEHKLKTTVFLTRILFKIATDTFNSKLADFGLELLQFYMNIHIVFQKHSQQNCSNIDILERHICGEINDFFCYLTREEVAFTDNLASYLDVLKTKNVVLDLKFLYFINEVVQILNKTTHSAHLAMAIIEYVFSCLSECYSGFYKNSCSAHLYEKLLINLSACLLLHNIPLGGVEEMLLKQMLTDNVFVATLALDIFTLIASNITVEEQVLLLKNLMRSTKDDVAVGYFTNRPETVYIKALVQRLHGIVPATFKVRLRNNTGIARLLNFSNTPIDILCKCDTYESTYQSTIDNIEVMMSKQTFGKDIILNAAENIHLLFTIDDISFLTRDPRFKHIMSLLAVFWSSDFSDEVLDNNVMKYFLSRITVATATGINTSKLDISTVYEKMETLSSHTSYWFSVLKIVQAISSRPSSQSINRLSSILKNLMKKHTLSSELCLEVLSRWKNFEAGLLKELSASTNSNMGNEYTHSMNRPMTEYDDEPSRSRKIGPIFMHHCLKWKKDEGCPRAKRPRFDYPSEFASITNTRTSVVQGGNILSDLTENTVTLEDDETISEVICRIKGEVKCLSKVCKNEKLTSKNVAHLRQIVNQLTALM